VVPDGTTSERSTTVPTSPIDSPSRTIAALLEEGGLSLQASATDRLDAVSQAGTALVRCGAVEPSYVGSMLRRETTVSTYVGNGVALPHGTNAGKHAVHRDALSLLRFPEGVDWNGETVHLVVGIAAAGGGHIAMLARIADLLLDRATVDSILAATSAEEVLAAFSAREPAPGEAPGQ
jgi:PTS system mannitol-specific IIA component